MSCTWQLRKMRSNQSREPKALEIATVAASLVRQGQEAETAAAEAFRIWGACQKVAADRANEAVMAREFENLKAMAQALPVPTEQGFEDGLNNYLDAYS